MISHDVIYTSADEDGIIPCNNVSDCGATFHQACLEAHNYDLSLHDGCIKCCSDKSVFLTAKRSAGVKVQATSKANSDLIVLDSDGEEDVDDDCVIVLD